MAKDLVIRSYQVGDEAAIRGLFQSAFGRSMSAAYWQWRFANNPTGQIVIDLAWSNDELASHYAVSPVTVCIGQQEYLTALSMTTMTHPDYRGRGLFPALAESVYERMSDRGMAMVWGFPNVISHRGFVRYLGWEDVYEMPTFRRVLGEGKPLPKPSEHVAELASFDDRFNHLWHEVRDKYHILTKRDLQYLSWRYDANPEYEYTVLGFIQGSKLSGYAVCKLYQNDVDLVDLLSVDDAIGLDLVCGVARWAVQRKAWAINLWLNVSVPLHRGLERLGFRNSEPVTYFGARVLQPEPDEMDVYNFKNWYLTMGDSDVY